MFSMKMFVDFFLIVLFTVCNGNSVPATKSPSTSSHSTSDVVGPRRLPYDNDNFEPQLYGYPEPNVSYEEYEDPDLKITKPTIKTEACKLTAEPPNPDSQCCGVDSLISNRIFGGETVPPELYPWLVLIEYHNPEKNSYGQFCGGSLISGRYVLTAGHCLNLNGSNLQKYKPISVRLGEYNTKNEGPDCVNSGDVKVCTDGAITVPIESFEVHPEYYSDQHTSANDIALIRLRELVNYTDFIRPVCLPKHDVTASAKEDLSLYAAGWGAISQQLVVDFFGRRYRGDYDGLKRHVALTYRNIEDCPDGRISNHLICAGGERGKDTCTGDSGGPLMKQQDGIYEVTGVVSFGQTRCGSEGYPGMYTKVIDFMDWIRGLIKG